MKIRLFICNAIIKQLDLSISEIMEKSIDTQDKNLNVRFIYAYAVFESTLTETLRYFLSAFPEKLEKSFTISKESILQTPLTQNIQYEIINSYIREFSSQKLSDYLDFYVKSMALTCSLKKENIELISKARNYIIHDNLISKSNLKYTVPKPSEFVTPEDLTTYVQELVDVLSLIKESLESKYISYTTEKLSRDLWSTVFSTSLVPFDKIWTISENTIHINDINEIKKYVQSLCRAEKLMFSIFLQQYSGELNDKLFKFNELPGIVSLNYRNRCLIIEIMQIFFAYPYLFNGEHFE